MDQSLPKLHLSDAAMASSRTFRRKGQTYVIKNTDSNEDVHDIFNMIDDMYDDISNKSYWAGIKAQVYKFFNIFIAIFIIIAGSIIGSLGASNFNIGNKLQISNITSIEVSSVQSILYAQTIIGFSITMIKSLSSLLNLEQRSITMKQISVQLRRISRGVKSLKNVTMPVDAYLRKLDDYAVIIDSLDINMFGELTFPTLETTNKQVGIIKEDVKTDNKTTDTVIPINTIV